MFRESSGIPIRTRDGISRGEDQQPSPLLRISPNSLLASSGFAGLRFSVEVTEKQCRQPISDNALPRLALPCRPTRHTVQHQVAATASAAVQEHSHAGLHSRTY
jgi:hypothetical protein